MTTPARTRHRAPAEPRPSGWTVETHLEDTTRRALSALRARLEHREARRKPSPAPEPPAAAVAEVLPDLPAVEPEAVEV